MHHRLTCWLVLATLLLGASTPAATPMRSLTHADYAAWRSIRSPALSPDGTVVAYALAPQEGDGEFIVRRLATGREFRHPRGTQPPMVRTRGTGRAGRTTTRALVPLFSPDSQTVLFPIYPTQAERKKSKTGATALGMLDLRDGKVIRVERVRSYQVPEEGPAVAAYLREPARDASKGTVAKGSSGSPGDERREAGELILRHLSRGTERRFPDVTEFSLSRDGQLLVWAAAGRSPGVYAVRTSSGAPVAALRQGSGSFSRLTWDEKQQQLAFCHSRTESGSPAGGAETRLYCWKRNLPTALLLPAAGLTALASLVLQGGAPATELSPNGKPGLPSSMEVSDREGLSFSLDGRRLYFSVAARTPPAGKTPGGEKAQVELWHFKDDYIQPIQKVRYNARPGRRAVFHLADGTCRQLGDEPLEQVRPASTGDWVLALDERPHRALAGIEGASAPADVYLVNSRTGTRRLLARKQTVAPSFSPEGRYVLSFDGKHWHAQSVPEGRRVNLTGNLSVSFVEELHDQPSAPPPYGVAGWTRGDTHVLLYDRHDVWLVAADGSGARNVTAGLGRKNATQYRVVRLDPKERAFDPGQPLLCRVECETTRDTGFSRVWLNGAAPKLLVMGARNHGTPVKAPGGKGLLLTISTFYDYPDLYTADEEFREVRRISNANPQKAGLVWGKAELVRYRNADGVPLQGVLIRPENFDPKKKYPLLVYIYERLSQNLHRFVDPQPGTSINPSYYASNGYLVLLPDIVYTVGHPGQSAVKCVLPAVQAVVDQGCVDEKAIGIQGHSWGGYQTAYLVTQTTRFRAAAAGAPVCNMTSAYGGIRWGTGLPRQFQYEKTQSRIGGTLWQYPTRYLENSPLFHADRVKTPLLMLHNDRDEAVPWQQGIEFYLALRRLGKEAYLFNYPGEMHGLRQRVNQKDYTVRMQQFFDHHLRGKPKPAWMAKGEPYTPPQPSAASPPTRRGRARAGSEGE